MFQATVGETNKIDTFRGAFSSVVLFCITHPLGLHQKGSENYELAYRFHYPSQFPLSIIEPSHYKVKVKTIKKLAKLLPQQVLILQPKEHEEKKSKPVSSPYFSHFLANASKQNPKKHA